MAEAPPVYRSYTGGATGGFGYVTPAVAATLRKADIAATLRQSVEVSKSSSTSEFYGRTQ